MSGYPRTIRTFIPWTKAMIQGATLDKPSYPGTKETARRRRKKRKKRRSKKNASTY